MVDERGVRTFVFMKSDPEDGGNKRLRNVSNYLPMDLD